MDKIIFPKVLLAAPQHDSKKILLERMVRCNQKLNLS